MLTPSIPQFRRRTGRTKTAAPTPTPPPAAGLALSAVLNVTFDGTDATCDLVFNTTVADPLSSVAGADPNKWTARLGGELYLGQEITNVAFDRLHLVLQIVQPEAGPDVINYANAPSDISDALGRGLAAFSDFPL
jgi:hypothetical protein